MLAKRWQNRRGSRLSMSRDRMVDDGSNVRNPRHWLGRLRIDERRMRGSIRQSAKGDAVTASGGMRCGLRSMVVFRMGHRVRAQHQR
jgi:hypothetical protein